MDDYDAQKKSFLEMAGPRLEQWREQQHSSLREIARGFEPKLPGTNVSVPIVGKDLKPTILQ